MTECDYSPAAYERYMKSQNRVSNWVSQTKAHARQYSNPFVPSTAVNGYEPSSASTSPSSPSPSESISQHPHSHPSGAAPRSAEQYRSDGGRTQPPPYGSGGGRTQPPPYGYGGGYPDRERPQRSKTVDSRWSKESGSPGSKRQTTRSRSQDSRTHSRSHHSHSQSYAPRPPPVPPMPTPKPAPIRSNTVPTPQHQPPTHHRNKTIDTYGPGAIHLRPGEYVIIPPGRQVEMLDSKGSVLYPLRSSSPASSRRGDSGRGGYDGHYDGHGAAKEPPLLKRIFGGFAWSGGSHHHQQQQQQQYRSRSRHTDSRSGDRNGDGRHERRSSY